ncbi:MAG: TolC family protein [Planctomycetota bacterium]
MALQFSVVLPAGYTSTCFAMDDDNNLQETKVTEESTAKNLLADENGKREEKKELFVFEPLNTPVIEWQSLPPKPKFPPVVAARLIDPKPGPKPTLVPETSSANIVIERDVKFKSLPPIPVPTLFEELPGPNGKPGSQQNSNGHIAMLPDNFDYQESQFEGRSDAELPEPNFNDNIGLNLNDFESIELNEEPAEPQSPLEEYESSNLDSIFLTTDQLQDLVKQPLLSATETQQFDLVQAIEILLKFSPLVRVAELERDIAHTNVIREEAAFDWSRFIETTWAESNNPVASTLDGAANRVVNHDFDISGGVTKLNRRGGNLTISQGAGLSDSNSSFFDPQNQADASIAIEYQRPLLQGGGKLVTTSRFEIANVEAAISEADLISELQRQILAVANAYWNLVNARGEFVIRQRTLDLGEEILDVIENRVGVDTEPVQLARARANFTTRQADFRNAKFALLTAQEQLLQLMFGANYQVNALIEVVTTAESTRQLDVPDLDGQLDIALQNRPEVRAALSTIERSSIEQGVARNQLLPALDLTMAVSNRAIRGNRGLASAFNEQFSFGDPSYSVGLSYALPRGNRAAKAGMDQARYRVRQFQQQLEQTISEVALDIKVVSFEILNAMERLEQAKAAFIYATEDYSVRLDRYELMLDDATDVTTYLDNLFSSQDRLAGAQREYIQALTECTLVNIRLQNARGTLANSIPYSERNSAK